MDGDISLSSSFVDSDDAGFPSGNNFICDICCEPVNYHNYSSVLKQFENEPPLLTSPSNEASSLLLREQLVLYFLGKKLLHLRDDQFLELLTDLNTDRNEEEGENRFVKQEDGEDRRMRGYYFNNFCEECEEIISAGVVMHREILDLQKRITGLGVKITEAIKCGVERSRRRSGFKNGAPNSTITRKIQSFVIADLAVGRKIENEDFEKKTTYHSVKVETDDNGRSEDGNENDIGITTFNVEMEKSLDDTSILDNHFENSPNQYIQEDQDEDEENDITAAAARRKRSKPNLRNKKRKTSSEDEDATSDDTDSDYQPEEVEEQYSVSTTRRSRRTTGTKGSAFNTKLRRSAVTARSSKSSKASPKFEFDPNQSSFSCDLCSMILKTARCFKSHLKMHEESSRVHKNKYDCPRCKYPALSEWKLRFHMTKAHQETQKNTCSICGYVGSRRWIYDKHMLEKHNIQVWKPIDKPDNEDTRADPLDQVEDVDLSDDNSRGDSDESKIYRCDICNYGYKILRSLQRHQNDHAISKQQNHKYDCDECKFPANSEKFLRYHMMKEHKKLLFHTCPVCGYQLKRRSQLKMHIKSKHGDNAEKLIDVDNVDNAAEIADQPCPPQDDNAPETFTKKAISLNEKFMCELCNTEFKTINGFRRHQNDHKISVEQGHKYDCDTCKFPANSEKVLRYHKHRVHQQYVLRICPLCGHQEKHLDQLKLHMKQQHNQALPKVKGEKRKVNRKYASKWLGNMKGGKFHCNLCKHVYTDSGTLKRHMDEHAKNEELGRKWECDRCKFPCSSEERLRRHVMIRHEKIKPTCTVCQKTFPRPFILREHMKMHKKYDRFLDSTTGLFRCYLCSDSFNSGKSLSLHMAQKHPNENNTSAVTGEVVDGTLLCSECGCYFSTIAQLHKHQRTKHEGRFRYTCDICGKGIDGKAKLERHKRAHEGTKVRDYVCEVCGSAFTVKGTLIKHMQMYHPSSEDTFRRKAATSNKIYRCKFCESEFPFKLLYEKHLSSAHKDRYIFKCDQCDKTYISASSLRLHKEIGHGEGSDNKAHSNTCQYCGKTFVHKHYVICHYKFCPVKRDLNLKLEPKK